MWFIPVIEENEETELKAALKMYKELSNKIFPDLKVGLLHGRLDADLERSGHAIVPERERCRFWWQPL